MPQSPPPDRHSEGSPGPTDELAIERIRRSVVMRIAEASTPQHHTVAADSDGWQAFLDQIDIKVLHESQGTLSYLLRLQPGAILPAHRHSQDEECVVLDGEIRIGDMLVVQRNGYHLAKAGAFHAQITTDTGALIFLRGAEPVMGDVL
jgi:oxalate decarboxylase/phosphoglucose isomerase-like protein (cupin superfamily)